MGIAADFPTAFGKAQAAAGVVLPEEGSVFITVTDTDKPAATQLAARFHDLGFEVIATGGTAQAIERMGVPVTRINKLGEGSPHVVDLIRERRCDLVINTPTGSGARADGYEIRTAAVRHGDPLRDDDDRRHRGRPGDRRRPPGRRRGALAPGDPRRRRLGARGGGRASVMARAARARSAARRRSARSARNRASGGYRVFSLLDREGPEPRPGQFYMLAAAERLGRGGREALPAAGDLGRRDRRRGRRRPPRLPGRGHRPRHRPPLRAEPGEGVWVTGPLGNAFAEPREVSPGAAGAILVGGGIGVAPLALLRRRFSGRGVRCASCSASATRSTAAASSSSAALLPRSASPPRTATAATAATSPTCWRDARGRRRRIRRRLRLRPAGDAGGGARALRRARRRLRAGAGVADGLRLRRLLRLRRAEAGRRLHAPLRRRARCVAATGSRRRSSPR